MSFYNIYVYVVTILVSITDPISHTNDTRNMYTHVHAHLYVCTYICRPGEIGEVIQIGERQISVRALSNSKRWLYDKASLVEVPGEESSTPEQDVEMLRDASHDNAQKHSRAVRYVCMYVLC
jgi:hypothetical protein